MIIIKKKSWSIILSNDNIFYLFPTNDSEPHLLEVKYDEKCAPYCPCKCGPTCEFEGENLIVVHNSFDGREGVEMANEILKNLK